MLEGDLVRLRPLAKEDLPIFTEWNNDPEFGGEYEPFDPAPLSEVEKWYSSLRSNEEWFLIEKKDGTKIGQIMCRLHESSPRIGYRIIASERRKGYCTDAVRVLVDQLFLSKNIIRIESGTNPENKASVRVLEKVGFTSEGISRNQILVGTRRLDETLYRILRDEWKTPRVQSTS